MGGRRLAAALALGAAGGAVFVFVFPRGAITTLVHHVLRLPGPGAGIALVVGPFALLFVLPACLWIGRPGGATAAALALGVTVCLVLLLTGVEMEDKGMFGSRSKMAAKSMHPSPR